MDSEQSIPIPGTPGEKLDAILRIASQAQIRQEMEGKLAIALNTASEALHKIGTHEELCSLRYKNIDDNQKIQTATLSSIEAAVSRLTKISYIQQGMWMLVVAISIIVGIIYTVQEITHNSQSQQTTITSTTSTTTPTPQPNPRDMYGQSPNQNR